MSDVAERDLLDGDSNGDAIGGFAAAARMLGKNPSLYSLDTSRAETPKARTFREDIARLVHGRLVNRRWIEGQLRHGWRGAAELAQGVDALFVFAATTDAVTNAALDAVYGAYVWLPSAEGAALAIAIDLGDLLPVEPGVRIRLLATTACDATAATGPPSRPQPSLPGE